MFARVVAASLKDPVRCAAQCGGLAVVAHVAELIEIVDAQRQRAVARGGSALCLEPGKLGLPLLERVVDFGLGIDRPLRPSIGRIAAGDEVPVSLIHLLVFVGDPLAKWRSLRQRLLKGGAILRREVVGVEPIADVPQGALAAVERREGGVSIACAN
jgi:hypothetical protein